MLSTIKPEGEWQAKVKMSGEGMDGRGKMSSVLVQTSGLDVCRAVECMTSTHTAEWLCASCMAAKMSEAQRRVEG